MSEPRLCNILRSVAQSIPKNCEGWIPLEDVDFSVPCTVARLVLRTGALFCEEMQIAMQEASMKESIAHVVRKT